MFIIIWLLIAGSVEKQVCYAMNAELSTLSILTAHLDSQLPPINQSNFNINKLASKSNGSKGVGNLALTDGNTKSNLNVSINGDSSFSSSTILSSTVSTLSSSLKELMFDGLATHVETPSATSNLSSSKTTDQNQTTQSSVLSDVVYLPTTLTLRRLFIYIYDIVKRLQILDCVCTEILRDNLHGCALLSFLHKCLLKFKMDVCFWRFFFL
jgi:hypothetical protein